MSAHFARQALTARAARVDEGALLALPLARREGGSSRRGANERPRSRNRGRSCTARQCTRRHVRSRGGCSSSRRSWRSTRKDRMKKSGRSHAVTHAASTVTRRVEHAAMVAAPSVAHATTGTVATIRCSCCFNIIRLLLLAAHHGRIALEEEGRSRRGCSWSERSHSDCIRRRRRCRCRHRHLSECATHVTSTRWSCVAEGALWTRPLTHRWRESRRMADCRVQHTESSSQRGERVSADSALPRASSTLHACSLAPLATNEQRASNGVKRQRPETASLLIRRQREGAAAAEVCRAGAGSGGGGESRWCTSRASERTRLTHLPRLMAQILASASHPHLASIQLAQPCSAASTPCAAAAADGAQYNVHPRGCCTRRRLHSWRPLSPLLPWRLHPPPHPLAAMPLVCLLLRLLPLVCVAWL